MNNSEKLLKMKESTEKNKQLKSRLEGNLESYHKQLDKDFNCKTVKEGESRLSDIDNQLEEKEELLNSGIEKLEEIYEW